MGVKLSELSADIGNFFKRRLSLWERSTHSAILLSTLLFSDELFGQLPGIKGYQPHFMFAFVISVILSFYFSELKASVGRELDELKVSHQALAQDLDTSQGKLAEMKEGLSALKDNHREIYMAILLSYGKLQLKTGPRERVTLYFYHKSIDRFVPICRISENPEYANLNRKRYPKSGCIHIAWKSKSCFDSGLPDPSQLTKYKAYQKKQFNIEASIVERFNMKPRLYAGVRVDAAGVKPTPLAVLILESESPDKFKKTVLEKLEHIADHMAILIHYIGPDYSRLEEGYEQIT